MQCQTSSPVKEYLKDHCIVDELKAFSAIGRSEHSIGSFQDNSQGATSRNLLRHVVISKIAKEAERLAEGGNAP
jgi:hypothetical protein